MRDKISGILAVIIPVAGILMQGCYFEFQASILLILFALLIFFTDVLLSKRSLILFLVIMVGFLLSGSVVNGFFEITKLSFVILPSFIANKNIKNRLITGLYTGCSISSVLGIAGFLFKIYSFDIVRNIDNNIVVQGLIGYANTMAVFCGIGLLLSFYYLKNNKNVGFLHELLVAINALCLFFTGSRLGIAALILSFIIFVAVKYKKPYILAFLLAPILLLPFVYDKVNIGSTLAWRFIYWYDGLMLFFKNPMGIGAYKWQELEYSVQTAGYSVKYLHNGFLQMALDGGFFALFGFLILITTGLFSLMKKYALYMAAVLFIAVHGAVDIDFAYGAIFLALGIFLSFSDEGGFKLNKYPVIVIMLLLSLNGFIFRPNISVLSYSNEFSKAYSNNDYQKMHEISKEWLKAAPRQQSAYDAYYLSVTALKKEDEISELYKTVDRINNSMNFFTKYLSQHSKIILPKEK